jgi:hypothetical protein
MILARGAGKGALATLEYARRRPADSLNVRRWHPAIPCEGPERPGWESQ